MEALKKLFVLNKRITRTECVVGHVVVSMIYYIFSLFLFNNFNTIKILILGVLLSLLGVQVIRIGRRRLHDIGMIGWFVILYFIPFVNIILIVFLFCYPGAKATNKYGENPRSIIC